MDATRRSVILGAGALAFSGTFATVSKAEAPLKLTVTARSPWMANQVALTSNNVMFLGCPRYTPAEDTPALVRRDDAGQMHPFPGNTWNEWKPGADGRDAFVYLNSVHIFADDTVWVVDQGSLSADAFGTQYSIPQPGAQKIVQLSAKTGEILKILRFDENILPAGAKMNDLRFHGSKMYVTESGLGALIIHDLETGETTRRLSGRPSMMAKSVSMTLALQPDGKEKPFTPPNADLIEISQDGQWLFWAAPTGPLYRIRTYHLNDQTLSDDALEKHIEKVADIEFSSGCAMDTQGNFYACETKTGRITVIAPSGKKTVLTSDPDFVRPDGAFISADRHLYVPRKPREPGGTEKTPFAIYSIALPESFDGIRLGDAVTG
jgi:sugar lactone lactonase YvrE